MNTATDSGAVENRQQSNVDPDIDPDKEVTTQRNPRDIALEAMGERQEQERRRALEEAMAEDPGLAHQQRQLEEQYKQQSKKSREEAGLPPENDDTPEGEGVASIERMHEDKPADSKDKLPQSLQSDPLADFIEMRDGAPMVKAKINGQDRLIPLDQARRQLQVGVAADARMQAAAQREKEIEARERRIAEQEANARRQASQPAQPQLSEEDLLEEAQDIFNTAFSGTEEEAARKLAKTLARLRAPATSAPVSIDEEAIVRRAASMAAGTLSQREKSRDVQKGFAAFKQNYSEILEDENLFRMADGMTSEIEAEHPDWDMTRVMDEAGKRTRAWVKSLQGESAGTDDESARRPQGESSRAATDSTQTRQERKAGLVRIPTHAAGGAQFESESEDRPTEQSPQDALRELKKARGQPY